MQKIMTAVIVLLLALSVSPIMAQTAAEEKALNQVEGTPMASPADVEIYSGTNVGGPEWDRPLSDPVMCSISSLGPVRYSDQPFFVAADGTCDFDSQQSYDGYLHIYEISWDPLDQCTNLIAGNDDGAGGIGTSNINGLSVTTGVTYWIVTSAFAAGGEGTFDNTISCDVDVTLGMPVPTMSGAWMTALILVLLAGGLLITRFRLG